MGFSKKTIRDIELKNKRVIVRAMLNAPIQDGYVTDRRRLESAKPTIDYLLDHGASLILVSHHSHEGQSLEPVAWVLGEILGREVKFVHDAVGPEAEAVVSALSPGEIVVLENLRFHPEEEANDEDFAKKLASYGDVFVQDDFTTAHRKHASMVSVPKLLPAVAGLQVEKEVDSITSVLKAPQRPLVAIVGGAKVSTKIPILKTLLSSVDTIFIGGAMANTFFLAQSKPVGKSLVEPDQVENAHQILRTASATNKKLLLPLDVVVTTDIDSASDVRTIELNEVGENDIIVDLGPQSIVGLERVLPNGGTVIWNGPVGIAEKEAFAHGTKGVAEAIIDSGAYSLIGGGDTTDYVDNNGMADKFSFVSTGGGASLELLSGNTLPGIEVLLDKDQG